MASIRRGTIVRDIIDSLKLQVGNVLPDQTSDKLVLTYDFSNVRVCNIVKGTSKTTTGAATVYTTPSTEDFYLTGFILTGMANATADNTYYNLEFSVNDAVISGATINKLSATAFNQTISLSLPIPIKIDKNTNIQIRHGFTTGASVIGATIFGYTVAG